MLTCTHPQVHAECPSAIHSRFMVLHYSVQESGFDSCSSSRTAILCCVGSPGPCALWPAIRRPGRFAAIIFVYGAKPAAPHCKSTHWILPQSCLSNIFRSLTICSCVQSLGCVCGGTSQRLPARLHFPRKPPLSSGRSQIPQTLSRLNAGKLASPTQSQHDRLPQLLIVLQPTRM